MAAYYNEIDKFAAAWLRELIKADCIAPGEVDERDIREVQPSDLAGFEQCHFFAGISGWGLALRQAGWPDERPVWSGSAPCQPFSAAGKRRGFSDERHLWREFFRLIAECHPDTIFGEQVASKDGLAWLDLVASDLEAENYAVGACSTCACGFGAPHVRQRLYWVAHSGSAKTGRMGNTHSQGLQGDMPEIPGWPLANRRTSPTTHGFFRSRGGGKAQENPGPTNGFWENADWLLCGDGFWRPTKPYALPLAPGLPGRMGRLRGYGNALCVPQAQAFIEAFIDYTLTGEGEAHDSKRVDLQDCQ